MFARIEIGFRPDYIDPQAQNLLRKIELALPVIRKKIRWLRVMDVYWFDLPLNREEMIGAIEEIFHDKVLQWLLSGNLIPSAAGVHGTVQDLLEAAPHRPGKFWGLERRLRQGVTDNIGKTSLEAFEIVLNKQFKDARSSSGSLVIFEGPELNDEILSLIGRQVLSNELIETYTVYPEFELLKSDRFHSERIKREFPKVPIKPRAWVNQIELDNTSPQDLLKLSQKNLWALSLEEMQAVRQYFTDETVMKTRKELGLNLPTDVELEVIAQTWSEHCKHKIFAADVEYDGPKDGHQIPVEISGLFKTTIKNTTAELPKDWLLSVFDDNGGIVAFDEEDAICVKVETHNSPSALDPYGGALTGIVGVNRDIMGCGFGAKPIFNTNVFCVAHLDTEKPIPEGLMHPRRILEGVRLGVEHGGNKSGIPTINGALNFDDRYLGKPLVYCGTVGVLPRRLGERRCEDKKIIAGDLVCMVGGRIGKDGIHGATFSSLALDDHSPTSAVQLGDPITQKRVTDFLLEARDQGLYRTLTDNGAGGLSSSVGEMAKVTNGAKIDLSLAKTKYPGLRPFELIVSESQERMTLAVPSQNRDAVLKLAEQRGVEVSFLGEFNTTGRFDVLFGNEVVASLSLNFLHEGTPKLKLKAKWDPPGVNHQATKVLGNFEASSKEILSKLLSSPNIASKEWLIRQYDHEVQGMSVLKPLHTVSPGDAATQSGPNDSGTIQLKPNSYAGLTVGCGLNSRLSDHDPFVMAEMAVDEAVRNVISGGSEYGHSDSLLSLVDNFCWPDPVKDPFKMGALVRACFGLRRACLELGIPLISGKDSMKNDYRGSLSDGSKVEISVPPTLLMTAVGKVPDVRNVKGADAKAVGDWMYMLGGKRFGLKGSVLESLGYDLSHSRIPEPDWNEARAIFSWLGGSKGVRQTFIKSIHDISEGGLLVAVCEKILARGFGIKMKVPDKRDAWEYCYGEGFHSFLVTLPENNILEVETEWMQLGIPFQRIGVCSNTGVLEMSTESGAAFQMVTAEIRKAWNPEEYWQ